MSKVSTVVLSDICDSVKYGFTASAIEEEVGPHFLRITDIVPETINWKTVPFCKPDDIEKERYSLTVGDIVVARTGATVGYAKLIREQVNAVFASYLVRFRVNPSLANPNFVGKIVESDFYKKYVQAHVGGSAQPNANAQVLGSFKFQLPEKQVQEEIASILTSYDDLIENNRKRIALLEEYARELYKEWFVRLRFPGYEKEKRKIGVPEGWERKVLGELCNEVRDIILPKNVDLDTPYIGLEHMPRRSISLNNWGNSDTVTSAKHKFVSGDILFGKIRPYFHKVGIAFVDGIASSDAIVIRSDEDNKNLVLLTVSSDQFIADTSQRMKEGSKMPRADWKQMQQYSVLKPKENILKAFNELMNPVMLQLKNLSLQNIKLLEARDILLPKLMNGEIKV
jgi:type I restriction enzyme S subunit